MNDHPLMAKTRRGRSLLRLGGRRLTNNNRSWYEHPLRTEYV